MDKRALLFFLLAFSMILAAGCPQRAPERASEIADTSLKVNPVPEVGVCSCMVCNHEDSDSWLAKLWRIITQRESTLLGGSCKFEDCLTAKRAQIYQDEVIAGTRTSLPSAVMAESLVKPTPAPNEDFLKYFMLGQGPTFSDFDTMDSYCNYSMGFSVRWWQPNNDLLFIPSKNRAGCYLDSDKLPVYIFKPDRTSLPTSGENSPLDLLGKLAAEMGDPAKPVGPVMIVPEPQFTSSAHDIANIAQEIDTIKINCPKCLIAVVPDQTVTPDGVNEQFDANGIKIGETEYPDNSALRALSQMPEFADVNMIGLHFFLNDFSPTCRSDEAAYRLLNYSRQTLAHYGKPSILLYYGAGNYVEVDPYTSVKTGCTADQVAAFYDYMGVHIPDMAQAGIIGSGVYQFVEGGINPGCDLTNNNYCDYIGVVDKDDNQKNPQLSVLANRCQFYYNGSIDTAGKATTPFSQVPLTFPAKGENTSICSFQSFSSTYANERLSSEPPTYDASTQAENWDVIGCNECTGGVPPARFRSGWALPYFDPYECSSFDDITRREAEKCDLDPYLVKAVIWRESDFDPSAVSENPGSSSTCAALYTGGTGCYASTEYYVDHTDPYFPDTNPFPGHECACGLMQVIDDYGSFPQDVCPNYDPFIPASSVCGGTYRLCEFKLDAKNFVDTHPDELGVTGMPEDKPEYRWAVAWALLLSYNAGPLSLGDYYTNWNGGGINAAGCGLYDSSNPPNGVKNEVDIDACCATDFMHYVNTCPLGSGGNPYAAQVIAMYHTIINTCPNNCNEHLAYVTENPPGVPDPLGGTPEGGTSLHAAVDCSYTASDVHSLCPTISQAPLTGITSCGGFCVWRPSSFYSVHGRTVAGHYHDGVDMNSLDHTVLSAQTGKVTFIGNRGGYGYRIEVTGTDGCTTTYNHLKPNSAMANAYVGAPVSAGDPLAIMDNTGTSFGSHLHFSVIKDGHYINPGYVCGLP